MSSDIYFYVSVLFAMGVMIGAGLYTNREVRKAEEEEARLDALEKAHGRG